VEKREREEEEMRVSEIVLQRSSKGSELVGTQRKMKSKAHLRESGSSSDVGDSRDEDSEVGSSDVGVSNELDQVGDDDTGHSSGVGGSLLEGSDEERNHDGEDGSSNLRDEGGGGESLDGGGDGRRGGHGFDESVEVRLEIRVVEASGKGSGGLLGSGGDLRGAGRERGKGEEEERKKGRKGSSASNLG